MESTNIDFKITDGVAVFTVKKESDLDLKIYNPEYFYSIGFEKVEIELLPPNQSGGAYSQEDYHHLTIPFKYFVYAVQGEGKPAAELKAEAEAKAEPTTTPKSSFNLGIFLDRFRAKKEDELPTENKVVAEEEKGWFGFNKEAEEPKDEPKEETKDNPKEESTGLFSIFKTEEKLETKPEEKVETKTEEKVEIEPEEKVETKTEEKVETEPEKEKSGLFSIFGSKEEPEVVPPVEAPQHTWIIKIPIITPSHCLGNNEYEIEECRFIERLKQIKRQRDVGVVMKNQQMYDVGKPLYLGQVVPDEKIELKFEKTLPGTLLDKYNRRGWV